MSTASLAAPKPGPSLFARRRPNLRVVPPAPAGSEPLPRNQYPGLHPKKGCRCALHTRSRCTFANPRKDALSFSGPRLVLWDVENWNGDPNADPLQVARQFTLTKDALGLTRDDYVVLGMSHFTADRCSFVFPTNQVALVVRSGPNGADTALIEAADLAALSKHFKTLMVISNDHLFAELAKQANALGMTTWIVSSDLAEISSETRAAYHGHTHLKLSVLRARLEAAEQERAERHLKAGTPAA